MSNRNDIVAALITGQSDQLSRTDAGIPEDRGGRVIKLDGATGGGKDGH